MADYFSLLAKAVGNLPKTSPPSARKAIYDRARAALIRQLRSLGPTLSEADIAREEAALEAAVARLEEELAAAPNKTLNIRLANLQLHRAGIGLFDDGRVAVAEAVALLRQLNRQPGVIEDFGVRRMLQTFDVLFEEFSVIAAGDGFDFGEQIAGREDDEADAAARAGADA